MAEVKEWPSKKEWPAEAALQPISIERSRTEGSRLGGEGEALNQAPPSGCCAWLLPAGGPAVGAADGLCGAT